MNNQEKQITIFKNIINTSTKEEQTLFISWANSLIEIRNSDLTKTKKMKKAIKITYKSKVILSILTKITKKLKKAGWDERSWRARAGLGTVLITLITVGNATGGLAFFGGAVAVPMWVLFGGGATVLTVVIEEFLSKPTSHEETSYTVINAKKED